MTAQNVPMKQKESLGAYTGYKIYCPPIYLLNKQCNPTVDKQVRQKYILEQ